MKSKIQERDRSPFFVLQTWAQVRKARDSFFQIPHPDVLGFLLMTTPSTVVQHYVFATAFPLARVHQFHKFRPLDWRSLPRSNAAGQEYF